MGEERRRVLVVDDDEVIRRVLVEALDLEGYEARGAADGLEALGVLDGWTPDVIVLDLMMPGMDGWEFRDEQRKRPEARDIPVVVISASRRVHDWALALRPSAVLAKPFEIEAFLQAVRELVS